MLPRQQINCSISSKILLLHFVYRFCYILQI